MNKSQEVAESNYEELIRKTVLSLLYLVFAAYMLTYTAPTSDLWGYMAFGRLFWASDKFPYKDIFAYLPTYDQWVYHEWLTGVLFFPLYQNFGASSLQLLKYCMGLATMGLIFITALRRGADFYSALWMLFAIVFVLAYGYCPARAQIFTFFFFALSLYLLETARLRKQWKLLWCLIPIQILWCNLHGGFVVGLGLISFYVVGEAISRKPFIPYLIVFIFSCLATLCNPYGIEYWQYFIRSLPMPRPEIVEWWSVYAVYKSGYMHAFAFLYIIITIILFALIVLWRKPRELTSFIGLGLTLYFGLNHFRHLGFFLIIAGAYMPVWLRAYLQKMKSEMIIQVILQRIGWKIPVLIGIFIIFSTSAKIINQSPLSLQLPVQPNPNIKFMVYYPLGAIDYIKAHALSGNILNEFHWGEYLIWDLYPQCRVSLDGRYEQVYPEDISKEFFDFIHARGAYQQFLYKYPPDMILISPQSKICSSINNKPEWQKVYADGGSVLFIKKTS
jgi:hypothetical protein